MPTAKLVLTVFGQDWTRHSSLAPNPKEHQPAHQRKQLDIPDVKNSDQGSGAFNSVALVEPSTRGKKKGGKKKDEEAIADRLGMEERKLDRVSRTTTSIQFNSTTRDTRTPDV